MMNTRIWGQILFMGEGMMWPQQAQYQDKVYFQAQAHQEA